MDILEKSAVSSKKGKGVRVRFAPSPTGNLHVGGARTALFNWLFARQKSGKFILRLEDTDKERSKPEYEKDIIDGLAWLGLNWDEGPDCGGKSGPYRQSERTELYKKHVRTLLDSGNAYFCYCSPEELEQRRQEAMKNRTTPKYDGRCRELTDDKKRKLEAEGRKASIRFKRPAGDTVVHDLIRGDVQFKNENLDDFIIARADGTPTYNFTVVIDDALMRISHVIRGDDHLSNTPKQVLLYNALGFGIPQFAHLPLIWGKDRQRLSKRHGAASVIEYRNSGYLPEVLVNFMVLLGWAFDDKQQVFSAEELISKFSLEKVSRNPAIFDIEKLDWLSGYYLRQMSDDRIAELCLGDFQKRSLLPAEPSQDQKHYLEKIAGLEKERLKKLTDLADRADFFFTEVKIEEDLADKVLRQPGIKEMLSEWLKEIKTIEPFEAGRLDQTARKFVEIRGKKLVELAQAIRVAVTGKMVSAGLFETMAILGRDKCCNRIEAAIKTL